MLAFLLVLERQRPPPEQYELKNVKECFGKKLPIRLEEDEVAVNFKWAHVAIAQEIKEKTEDSGVELSSSMLEIVKSNMKKNYEAREWNWNWKEPGLGQQWLSVPTAKEPFIYRRRRRHRPNRQRKPPKTKRLGG
ncbi:hypothetical protein AX14_009871 [Amanita brunnescens Koide BX004]|nr:hypothetical protein AX14_009871 [Amanita brunnescens Koide BX004]